MGIPLKGKNVLITGGSAGLGAEVARHFAKRGSNVAINYAHQQERARKLAKEIADEHGVRAVVIQADVAQEANCAKLVDTAVEQLGGLDIVVSNAGWTKTIAFDDFESLDSGIWDKTVDMNLKSHYYVYKAAKPHLEKCPDGGSFIVSGSVGGLRLNGSSLAYCASKAALIHLVKCLARTCVKIRSNIICPGLLLTDWSYSQFGEETIQQIIKGTPLKQESKLDDVANMVITIAENSSMTGSVVSVDAGLSVGQFTSLTDD